LIYSSCQQIEGDDYFFQLTAAAFYPVLLAIASAVLWSLANVKLKYSCKKLMTVVLSSFVAVYNLIQLLSLAIASMYQCTTVAGHSWLVMDTSYECWTGTHLIYIYKVTIPAIIFLTGVYMVAIWCIKHPSSTGVLRYVCQYMTAGYKPKYAAWEFKVMQEKFLLVWLSLAYPLLDKFSKIILFICIVGWAVHLEVKRQPYSSNWIALVSNSAQVSTVIVVFTAAKSTETQMTVVSILGSVGVMVLSCAAFCLSKDKQKYEVTEQQRSEFGGMARSVADFSASSFVLCPHPALLSGTTPWS
jgi:hypothetical protein